MDSANGWRLGRQPGLDGLRGVAIVLVIASHVWPDQIGRAGTVGVTTFFALSGFLITSLLVEERATSGRVSFRRFYARRVRRLAPALAVLIVFVAIAQPLLLGLNPVAEIIATATYWSNWALAGGAPFVLLGHTWSLAIEEQFYLLWPLAFLVARRWTRFRVLAAAVCAVAAVVVRVVLWSPTPNQWRPVYYRTDARMDALLIGCLLALAVHRYGVRRVGGAGALGAGVLAFLLVPTGAAMEYVWAPLLAALATCGLIWSTLLGGSRWLSLTPLRWAGRRSYALYLWHWPLLVLADPARGMIPAQSVLPIWLAVVLAFIAAEVSWWFIERPFLRPGIIEATGQVTRKKSEYISHPVPAVSSFRASPMNAGVKPGLNADSHRPQSQPSSDT